MAAILLVVLCVAVLGVKGQFVGFGKCPNVTGSTNFKIEDFLGVWYHAQGYRSPLDLIVKCPAIEYGLLPNGKLLVEKYYTDVINHPRTAESIAVVDREVPYRFHWNLPNSILFSTFQTDVLFTDYKDYAIIWACREILFARHEFASILTRQRRAKDETIKAARKKMEELELNTGWLADVDQSRCKDVTPRLSSNTTATVSTNENTTTTNV